MRPGSGKRRARLILPALYIALAVYIWFDFAAAPPDGLANLGLFAVTLPVSMVGLAIGWITGARDFVLLPHAFGYLTNHALYFVPAAAMTACLVWLLGRAIDRRPS
jgi:hypothetical protein